MDIRKRRHDSNLDNCLRVVIAAIMKKRLNLKASLYSILLVLSVSVFERVVLNQLLTESDCRANSIESHNQLILFS